MKIEEKRQLKGLNRYELANLVGISFMSYYRYEKGYRVPDARTAIRIAKALDTTVEELWDGNPT